MYILIVDDNKEIAKALAESFDKNHKIDCFYTYDDASERISYMKYDVVCLDVYLDDGKMSGIDLCRQVRKENPQAIIIMFTGEQLQSRMAAMMMEAGANSFIEKSLANVNLVQKAIELIEKQRREYVHTHKTVFQHPIFEKILVDIEKRTLSVDGVKKDIDAMPMRILHFLMQRPNEYFQSEVIAREVKDARSQTGISVKAHISTIRKTIQPYDCFIENNWGGWYGFVVEGKDLPTV